MNFMVKPFMVKIYSAFARIPMRRTRSGGRCAVPNRSLALGGAAVADCAAWEHASSF
jgi:hypothetical protein